MTTARRPSTVDTDLFSPNMMAIMHNVSTITDIKTEIGYSRAWIRLALEQKVNLINILKILMTIQRVWLRFLRSI